MRGGEGASHDRVTPVEAVLVDLELQASGLQLVERDAELADRRRAEYAQVQLAGRVHGSLGARVEVMVAGAGGLRGRLVRAGVDWCQVDQGSGRSWLVRLAAVLAVRGLSSRTVAPEARPVTARLGFSALLRALQDAAAPVVLVHRDGSRRACRVARVGGDFVEVHESTPDGGSARGAPLLVPFDGLAAVLDSGLDSGFDSGFDGALG